MSTHRHVRSVFLFSLVAVFMFHLLIPAPAAATAVVKWRETITESSYAYGPALGPDGTVYVTTSGCVSAYSPDGSLRWKTADSGYRTPPTVSRNGTIYVGESNALVAMSPDSSILWRKGVADTIGWGTAPSIGAGNTIHIGTKYANMYTFSPDGTLLRKLQGGGSSNRYASAPAVDSDGTIYFGGHNFYAFDQHGTEKWQTTGGSFDSTCNAALGKDGTIYTNNYLNIHALNPSDGSEIWERSFGFELVGSPAIGEDGTIYFGLSGGNFTALDKNGVTKWQFDTGSSVRSPASIGDDGTIYILTRDDDGVLHALSPSGAEKWSYNLDGKGDTMTNVVLDVDGTIYAVTCDGSVGVERAYLYAFEADAPGSYWPMFRTPTRRAQPQTDGEIIRDTDQDSNTYAHVEYATRTTQTAQAIREGYPDMTGYTPEEPTISFEGIVTPTGSNATFSLAAADLNGTVSEYGLYMLQDNGTLPFVLTSRHEQIHIPGRWWIAEANGTVPMGPADTLTTGTSYHIHFTIQDNGLGDASSINRTIASKMTFGRFPAAISPDQLDGVTACINNATVQSKDSADLVTTYGKGGDGILPVSQMLRFSAEVSPAGSLAVFRWNSTKLEGNLTTMTPRKYFDADLSYVDYGDYFYSPNEPMEGNWWVTYRNNTRLERNATLTAGTNYFINLVIKDNGKYDADPAAGKIVDPVVLTRTADGSAASTGTTTSSTTGSSSSGCMMNPTAGFGAEWLMLLATPMLGMIRFRRRC